MTDTVTAAMLREAELAVENAQQVRAYHRKRTEKANAQRRHDLTLAMKRVQAAMKPIRSQIGKFPSGPQTQVAENRRQSIREASQALQRERRKLWKMLNRPIKEPK